MMWQSQIGVPEGKERNEGENKGITIAFCICARRKK
jgi:hypothetical protein